MKTYGEVDYNSPFLTSILDEVKGLLRAPIILLQEKEAPGTI
jgi:hypothetical protein